VRPVVVDLFAGVGGLSLGFEQAGFDPVVAVEIDPVHAAVHKFNFPQTHVIASSVVGLTGAEIRARAGLGRRKVSVVVGGAPCQGFSLMGQRALDDPRNMLVREFVRIVVELKSDYFVFENVKGLTLGKHRQFLEELVALFDAAGYKVRTPWRVLNASSFGVPQNRERLFLLGCKKGLKPPAYPVETTHTRGASLLGLRSAPTCADALSDLPDADMFDGLEVSDATPTPLLTPSKYARDLRCMAPAAWRYGFKRVWDQGLLTSSMRTVHSAISRRRFAATRPGDVEPISRFFKLDPHGFCNTLRAGTDAARGAFTSPRPIHYLHPRCITVREMARLHGFPDWFRLHATKWHGARQVGNSVPPPLARAVAESIVAAIGYEPLRPRDALLLGDEKLLNLDMKGAAAYWGVAPLGSKRTTKSGAVKRKQADIEALAA
jgi:DNA (cytosine-5)-methyltransferase 1